MPITKISTRCSICPEHRLYGNSEFLSEMKIDIRFINSTRNYSQISTMSQNSTPVFVYQRRKHRKNSVDVMNLNACNAKDDCSSSKSNFEVSTSALKIDSNDTSECSSSGALLAAPPENSERDIIVLILKTQGLLDEVLSRRDGAFTESNGFSRKDYCSKSCKVCEYMDSTSNMLICDTCEDAFHISCYNPRITRVPVSQWLCSSCSKKKSKTLSNVVNISTENGRNQNLAPEIDLGSLEFMFRDPEPYMSNVRIGNDFQAVTPGWCGPVNNSAHNCYRECDVAGIPLETNSSKCSNVQGQDSISIKPPKLSSIGNWLQCRATVEGNGEGDHEKICGKWRRAPLYEVQTDKWECFCCVLWDRVHADCAVPQELPTDEVMKQLKYVEMLRPRPSAKRRKLDSSKSNNSQDEAE